MSEFLWPIPVSTAFDVILNLLYLLGWLIAPSLLIGFPAALGVYRLVDARRANRFAAEDASS